MATFRSRPGACLLRAVGLAAGLAAALSAPAASSLFTTDSLDVYGDFRLRLESDWGSQRADGSERDDRTRARVRVRLGLTKQLGEGFSFGLRLRSGSDLSHQSAHITVLDFDGNDTGDADVNLDKWFLSYSKGAFSGWVGRNGHPFWKQNEMLLDDDATLAGVGFAVRRAAGGGANLALNGGYFSLPVGLHRFAGNLGALQAVYSRDSGGAGATLAAGLYSFDANPRDADAARLLNGNGSRDYLIYLLSGQLRRQLRSRPLVLAADFLHNAESYPVDGSDPFARSHRGETDGFVVSLRYGATKQPRDRQFRYDFARIEALAANSSFAQDDWVRWGSSTETRATDIEGHELRFTYVWAQGVNLVARLYLVDAISSREDGNRLRLDLNYRF